MPTYYQLLPGIQIKVLIKADLVGKQGKAVDMPRAGGIAKFDLARQWLHANKNLELLQCDIDWPQMRCRTTLAHVQSYLRSQPAELWMGVSIINIVEKMGSILVSMPRFSFKPRKINLVQI